MTAPTSRVCSRHLFLVIAALTWLAACAPRPASGTTQTVTVFAAASLVDAFETAGQAFSQANPGVSVVLNFAASDQLAQQLLAGAPADVFASADPAQMQAVVDGGLIEAGAVRALVHNSLVIVAPADNPAGVSSLEDLARPGVRLVLAAPEVPAGRYAAEMLHNAAAELALGDAFETAVLANVASYEENVRAVLAKVTLGEADAGIVYRTDARSAGDDVVAIDIPSAWNVTAEYPLAVLARSAHAEAARRFVEYLLSPAGQALLAEHGFETGGTRP